MMRAQRATGEVDLVCLIVDAAAPAGPDVLMDVRDALYAHRWYLIGVYCVVVVVSIILAAFKII
jgi:hypothetical protein